MEVIPVPSPDEEHLARLRAELASITASVAERELALQTLEGELAAFERKCHRVLGPRYALLAPECAILSGAISGRALYDGRIDVPEALKRLAAAR